jgi:hypothetical protein
MTTPPDPNPGDPISSFEHGKYPARNQRHRTVQGSRVGLISLEHLQRDAHRGILRTEVSGGLRPLPNGTSPSIRLRHN